jgi:hypothetical protein
MYSSACRLGLTRVESVVLPKAAGKSGSGTRSACVLPFGSWAGTASEWETGI